MLAGFQLQSPQVTSISVAMMIPQNQAIIDVARAELLYGTMTNSGALPL
jgi:hypothetical protein